MKRITKSIKGSAVAFAVAAVFAGGAMAHDDTDSILACVVDVGFTTDGKTVNPANGPDGGTENVDGQTGVWQAITKSDWAFQSAPTTDPCMVPKNTKGKTVTEQVAVSAKNGDQCSMYQSLGSANQKLMQGKLGDAFSTLSKLKAKADTLSQPDRKGKVKLAVGDTTQGGAALIMQTVQHAMDCVAAQGPVN
jgi:hypothetical protein